MATVSQNLGINQDPQTQNNNIVNTILNTDVDKVNNQNKGSGWANALSKANGIASSLSATALKIIMSYVNAYSLAGVIIKVESLIDMQDSDVSEKVIIDNTGGRKRIQDNISPRLREWHITGYLDKEEYEISTYYITSLERKRKKIEDAKNSRMPVDFKDKSGKTHQVTIETFHCNYDPKVQSAIPVELVLKKWEVLKANPAQIVDIDPSAFPDKEDEVTDQLGSAKPNVYDQIGKGTQDVNVVNQMGDYVSFKDGSVGKIK